MLVARSALTCQSSTPSNPCQQPQEITQLKAQHQSQLVCMPSLILESPLVVLLCDALGEEHETSLLQEANLA
jgi:hypothetical protein